MIKYETKPRPGKDDFIPQGESLTEQEHKDSCDINHMLRDVHRGLQVRGGKPIIYGHDDTTTDGVSHRILKQRLEKQLEAAAASEMFSEEELKYVSTAIQKKFGFKLRKKQNDDQTTKQNSAPPAENSPTTPNNPAVTLK